MSVHLPLWIDSHSWACRQPENDRRQYAVKKILLLKQGGEIRIIQEPLLLYLLQLAVGTEPSDFSEQS